MHLAVPCVAAAVDGHASIGIRRHVRGRAVTYYLSRPLIVAIRIGLYYARVPIPVTVLAGRKD